VRTHLQSTANSFNSCSVDTGFILALPLHHRDLELDSVGVSTKSYLKIMLLFGSMAIYGWVAFARDKNTCAKTLAENDGGGLHVKRGVYGISVDKEGCEELRDWMAIFVQLLDMDIGKITRKEVTRVGAIRFWGGSFHKPPPYRNSPVLFLEG